MNQLAVRFGLDTVRAIGVANDKPLLATYSVKDGDWAGGETDLTPQLATAVLARMRRASPAAFQ